MLFKNNYKSIIITKATQKFKMNSEIKRQLRNEWYKEHENDEEYQGKPEYWRRDAMEDDFQEWLKQQESDNEDTESVESHDECDDHGVLCHYSRTTGGWEAIEPFCVECGYGKGNCECIKCEEEEEYCNACREILSYEDDKKTNGLTVCNACYICEWDE